MTTEQKTRGSKSRYEFRVWGSPALIGERLAGVADSERQELCKDCYLLVDDPARNIKVRRSRLKVKTLVEERFGFQRWSSSWHRITVRNPERPLIDPGYSEATHRERPLDLPELGAHDANLFSAAAAQGGAGLLVRSRPYGGSWAGVAVVELVGAGQGSNLATSFRPVFVTKFRRRYRFGSMRAEVSDLVIDGRPGRLSTMAIEGRNLVDLIHLRSSLGMDLVPNVAVPWVLDPLRAGD